MNRDPQSYLYTVQMCVLMKGQQFICATLSTATTVFTYGEVTWYSQELLFAFTLIFLSQSSPALVGNIKNILFH